MQVLRTEITYNVHTHSHRRQSVYILKTMVLVWGVWSKVSLDHDIEPRCVVWGIRSIVFDPRYWSQVDSVHGIEKGQKLYKEERIISPDVQVNKILRNTSILSIFYVAGLCLGLDLKYLCAPWVQYWIRIMRPKMTYYWMIWYCDRSNYVHLLSSLNIVIWICLKSWGVAKLWSNYL